MLLQHTAPDSILKQQRFNFWLYCSSLVGLAQVVLTLGTRKVEPPQRYRDYPELTYVTFSPCLHAQCSPARG